MIVELTKKLIHRIAPYAQYTLRRNGNTIYSQTTDSFVEGLVDSKQTIESLSTQTLEGLYNHLRKINFENFTFETYKIYDHNKYLELMKTSASILCNLCITEILKRKEKNSEVGASC